MQRIDVLCLGELLVDFIGQDVGELQQVSSFCRYPGGSAANVAAGLARLGVSSGIVTRLGQDPFGDFLLDTMHEYGVDTALVKRDENRRTSLAFVSHDSDREPSYMFYRHPSASMYLRPADVDRSSVTAARLLYTSSMSIVNRPFRDAIYRAARIARRAETLVSFDMNLRLDLWRSRLEARKQIMAFLRVVDILKISQHELDLLCPAASDDSGGRGQLSRLFEHYPNLRLVTLTRGDSGSICMLDSGIQVSVPAIAVDPSRVVDTTGAGDAYMTGMLGCIVWETEEGRGFHFGEDDIRRFGEFASGAAAFVIQKPGVIPALPTKAEIRALLQARHEAIGGAGP